MKRRLFLGFTGGMMLWPLPGCLNQETPIPAGMEVETQHWIADILTEGIWYQRQDRDRSINRYHTLIEDKSTANRQLTRDDEVAEFIAQTDFQDAYVVVVQNIMQSARWLELQRIERIDDGIEIAVSTESPDDPYGDDATAHSLAIRVIDEEAGTPDSLSVTIDGKPTSS